jgi:isopentenyl-diphosphate delta-isomerase
MDWSEESFEEIITTKTNNTVFIDDDKTAASRKQDHIELAFRSQVQQMSLDNRFYYEPMLAAHPKKMEDTSFAFLGKTFRAPLWVSSMTGGTEWAKTINHNLARAANEFGFGMGLGSCRSLLTENEYLPDFDVRKIIGDDLPLYANLGIAQIEKLIDKGQIGLISNLVDKLSADGLIVHINPMQEWLQPEGDHFNVAPLVTLTRLIDALPELKLIVKEVGQGMGYHSLKALLQMPLEAIDFAASGGTNFAMLELLRSDEMQLQSYEPLTKVGHSAEEMVGFVNRILAEEGNSLACKQVIISGGIQSFLDGYYLTNKINAAAIYGQASAFLKYARGNYEELHKFVDLQIKGLRMAERYLKVVE